MWMDPLGYMKEEQSQFLRPPEICVFLIIRGVHVRVVTHRLRTTLLYSSTRNKEIRHFF